MFQLSMPLRCRFEQRCLDLQHSVSSIYSSSMSLISNRSLSSLNPSWQLFIRNAIAMHAAHCQNGNFESNTPTSRFAHEPHIAHSPHRPDVASIDAC